MIANLIILGIYFYYLKYIYYVLIIYFRYLLIHFGIQFYFVFVDLLIVSKLVIILRHRVELYIHTFKKELNVYVYFARL